MPMATSRVTPLNSGSTQKEPPNCWMPEMPTARMIDADDRAPDVDPPRLDRGRAEEGADQRRQQEFEPDAGLADAQLGGEQNAGEGGQRARGDEGADDVFARRDAVQLRRARVGADGVEVAADRAVFEDHPQHEVMAST